MDLSTLVFLELREAISSKWFSDELLEKLKSLASEVKESLGFKDELDKQINLGKEVREFITLVSLRLQTVTSISTKLLSEYQIQATQELKNSGEKRPTKDLIKAHIIDTKPDYNHLLEQVDNIKILLGYVNGLRDVCYERQIVLKEKSINARKEYNDEYNN